MNLFSVFDPVSIFELPLNWVAGVLSLMLFSMNFWTCMSKLNSFMNFIFLFVIKEFKINFGVINLEGLANISSVLFSMIVIINFMGLFPYVFTVSAHLSMTLALAFPVWMGLNFMNLLKTPQIFFSHLVPLGSPNLLSPLMVLIELISSLIRPVTLAVRLAANMVAGHLLMSLISNPMTQSSLPMMSLIFSGLLLLSILESAVAIIQAYVFSVLTSLYFSEANSWTISF